MRSVTLTSRLRRFASCLILWWTICLPLSILLPWNLLCSTISCPLGCSHIPQKICICRANANTQILPAPLQGHTLNGVYVENKLVLMWMAKCFLLPSAKYSYQNSSLVNTLQIWFVSNTSILDIPSF